MAKGMVPLNQAPYYLDSDLEVEVPTDSLIGHALVLETGD